MKGMLGKRSAAVRNAFADDDDEEQRPVKRPKLSLWDDEEEIEENERKKNMLAHLSTLDEDDADDGPEKANTGETGSAGSDDVDPLDAFMNTVEETVEREKHTTAAPKAVRKEYEEDDDADAFMMSRATKQKEVSQSEDSGEDYTKMHHTGIAPLQPVYHSEIEYPPFSKGFYRIPPELERLDHAEVDRLRRSLHIRASGDNVPPPAETFAQLCLDAPLLVSIRKLGFEVPTPIQRQAVPVAMSGRDLVGIAKTGSGKTGAFVWPLVIHTAHQRRVAKGEGPIGLIVAPTHELANQIFVECKRFCKGHSIRVAPVYGGAAKVDQIKELKNGVEIVVATPGRLIEMVKKRATNLRRVTMFILDEADRMFDMGFEPQVRSIAQNIRPDRQTMLFSATFKKRVERAAAEILTDPIRVTVGTVGESNADIKQVVHILTDNDGKWRWLKVHLPVFVERGSVLVFVNTKDHCEELSDRLNNILGFRTASIHGDRVQIERKEIMRRFKTNEIPILVATDVASRGLDIKSIKTVINYDTARDMDSHVHRIGRTGRGGDKEGVAYTLVTPKNARFAGELVWNLEAAKQKVPEDLLELALRDKWFSRQYEKGKRGGRGSGRGGERRAESHDGGAGRGGGSVGRGKYGAVAPPSAERIAAASLQVKAKETYKRAMEAAVARMQMQAAMGEAAPGQTTGSDFASIKAKFRAAATGEAAVDSGIPQGEGTSDLHAYAMSYEPEEDEAADTGPIDTNTFESLRAKIRAAAKKE